MSEKRSLDPDLNCDDSEEIGAQFKTAPADELQSRVIKKARRKISASSEVDGNKTVFSGFTGFKKFTNSPIASTASPFSFLNKISSTTSTAPTMIKNGSHKPKVDYSRLERLNQDLIDWIKKNIEENPICILTPMFKDYENYVKEIMESDDNASKGNDQENLTNVTSTSSNGSESKPFSFGSNLPKVSVNDTETPSSPGVFAANLKGTNSTSIFGSSGGFQFGKSNAVGSTTTSPSSGFSFTNSKPFTFGGSVSNQNNALDGNKVAEVENEEDEEPPKNDFKAVVEEDSVYSKRCKVFVKHDGNFADRGVGTLYLKPIKDQEKTQLIVRADTNLGNILLNFILSEGLPTQRMGKNNVMVVCVPTPECEQKPTSVLLRVKTSQEADELLETINKYKK
ncbi:nuclear pore complex protein Nup50 [Condylostylus longicornis]|uniref:nuclear pore complex protein Nup50 n=1 Tax=Condylostylus longicornis TaxID=2530218 RepID=UPI00244E4715|nr:nuclear pore complex protein Nup50 [Condylostylus longicornis]